MNHLQFPDVYNGYLLLKARPLPRQTATWSRVERIRMHRTQHEFYDMVHNRALAIDAASQYDALNTEVRAQVDQLIYEKRQQDPGSEWTCAYAKECKGTATGHDTAFHDSEPASVTVILMRRPWCTKIYPRTPMGDLVDLRISLRPDQYARVSTAPGFPSTHAFLRDFAMSNTHQMYMPPPTGERICRTCLQPAPLHPQSRITHQSVLPDRNARADREQAFEDEDSEESEREEERNHGYDEAQRANTAHGRRFVRGKPAFQNQRSSHNPRRIGPHIARAYRKLGFRNSHRKWAKAYQVASKGRLRRLQKV